MAEWKLPTGHNDPSDVWASEKNAYDGKTTTRAGSSVAPMKWSGFLELTIDSIYCSKIRFWANYSGVFAIDKIDIDVYYNHAWHDVYIGSFLDETWVEKNLADIYYVSKMRIRFRNGAPFWSLTALLYEAEFYQTVGDPLLTTKEATDVEDTTATLNGEIDDTGGAVCTERGFKYKKVKAIITGTGIAFVDGGAGEDTITDTGSGFVTAGFEAGDVITVSGSASNDGDYTIISVVAGTINIATGSLTAEAAGATITITTTEAEQSVSDSGSFIKGEYSKDITGLDNTKIYYFRAYAINSAGTGYGEWKSFGKSIFAPTITSSAATSVNHEKATLNGEVTFCGGQDPKERGFEWKEGAEGSVSKLKETGSFSLGTFSLVLSDLDPNITYYFRAYALNDAGTGTGNWLDFTTELANPIVKTHSATNEQQNQVTGNGEIVSTGGQDCDERGFEYGLNKVATWTKKETAGGYGVGFFNLTIDGLTVNTEYWYRAWAKFKSFYDSSKTDSLYDKEYPQLQVVGDKIYYVWQEDDGTYTQIWTAVMNTDGSGFTATKRTTSSYNKTRPQLEVVGSKIYYVWSETDGTRCQIWTAIMDTDEENWSATKRTTSATNKYIPQLQVVDSLIYYVFEDKDPAGGVSCDHVHTAKMNIDQTGWETILDQSSDYGCRSLNFRVVGSKIHYVYYEYFSLVCVTRTAVMDTDGSNWSSTRREDTGTDRGYSAQGTQLEVVGSKIYYVWTKDDNVNFHIYTAVMNTDQTGYTRTQRRVSADEKFYPQMQIVSGKIYYVWQESDGTKYQIWVATMDISGSNWGAEKKTTSAFDKTNPQFQVISGDEIYYVWQENDGTYEQIRIGDDLPYTGYGEWIEFRTAAVGIIPSGTLRDICSDHSGCTYLLNASLTDDGASYESYFVLSTDLSGKKSLHILKRLLDILSYFAQTGIGTAKISVKQDSEPDWQYAGEINISGEGEINIAHLPVDYLAKHYLIKFVLENDFEFIGLVCESVPIGKR